LVVFLGVSVALCHIPYDKEISKVGDPDQQAAHHSDEDEVEVQEIVPSKTSHSRWLKG
jgi:hypothetical protein